jgi:hypothetical protein
MADEDMTKTFTQDEVNGMIANERRAIEEKYGKTIAEKDKAIESLAKEKDGATALATQADERIKAMEDDLNSTKRDALKFRIGLDKGLPLAVAERLQGDDEAALASDADTLAELLKKPGGNEGRLAGGPPEGGKPDKPEDGDMDAMIRRAAGRG